jgi:interferon-induced GTP-binding protein Mx1
MLLGRRDPQPPAAGEIQSPEEIADVIQQLSDAVVAASPHRSHAAISSHTIVLRVTAPNVPDLSLVDLPGIVRTATSGQSRGVIAEVDTLIQSYIQQENTIILAVVPANQDIATVDILERAHQVDSEGRRTIGTCNSATILHQHCPAASFCQPSSIQAF